MVYSLVKIIVKLTVIILLIKIFLKKMMWRIALLLIGKGTTL